MKVGSITEKLNPCPVNTLEVAFTLSSEIWPFKHYEAIATRIACARYVNDTLPMGFITTVD